MNFLVNKSENFKTKNINNRKFCKNLSVYSFQSCDKFKQNR